MRIGLAQFHIWGVLIVSLTPCLARGGRPLVIDDAEPVDLRHVQFQGGVAYTQDPGEHFGFPLGVTYGLLPGLEMGLQVGAAIEEREEVAGGHETVSGLGDLVLSSKWKFVDQADAILSQAVAGSVKFPTANRERGLGTGRYDFDLTWIGTRSLTEKTAIDANVGYTWTGDPHGEVADDLLHYGVAMRHQWTQKLEPVVEVLAITGIDGGGTDAGIDAGIRWEVVPKLVLDAAVGTKLAGDWPNWRTTVGFTWEF